MQTYKFDTRISENGIISIPQTGFDLYGKEVEIFISIQKKEESEKSEKIRASEFVNRWVGTFKSYNDDIDNAKYEYLSEKYK